MNATLPFRTIKQFCETPSEKRWFNKLLRVHNYQNGNVTLGRLIGGASSKRATTLTLTDEMFASMPKTGSYCEISECRRSSSGIQHFKNMEYSRQIVIKETFRGTRKETRYPFQPNLLADLFGWSGV